MPVKHTHWQLLWFLLQNIINWPNGPLGRPLANGVTPRRDASVPHAATGAVVLHAIPVI